MPKFKVTLEKQQTITGFITVEARSEDAAERAVNRMILDRNNPLQTTDSRIKWIEDEPLYNDGSFQTAGDVERA
jgi:hypothetical protein